MGKIRAILGNVMMKNWGHLSGGFRAMTVLFAAAIFMWSCSSETVRLPEAGVIRLSDQFTGDYSLVNQDGAPVSSVDFNGKVQVIYFGFATCPDVCPLSLGRLHAALSELSEKEKADLQPLFITVDPERDTPEALKAYLSFAPEIIGLTGSEEAVTGAKQSFKVFSSKRPMPESDVGYTVDHTSLFYLVDRKGAPRIALQDSLTPEELATAIRQALKWR